jgi:hypothetical protein
MAGLDLFGSTLKLVSQQEIVGLLKGATYNQSPNLEKNPNANV